jgi:hypothetical protein
MRSGGKWDVGSGTCPTQKIEEKKDFKGTDTDFAAKVQKNGAQNYKALLTKISLY